MSHDRTAFTWGTVPIARRMTVGKHNYGRTARLFRDVLLTKRFYTTHPANGVIISSIAVAASLAAAMTLRVAVYHPDVHLNKFNDFPWIGYKRQYLFGSNYGPHFLVDGLKAAEKEGKYDPNNIPTY